MERRTLGRLALVGALVTGACATNRVTDKPLIGADSESVPMVTVRNDNWLDVAIYVVHGTSRFRIGTVSSTTSETFRLTSDAANGTSPLQILADPIGDSRAYVTDPVVLGPGQRLEVKVGSPISISSFWVRND